MEKQPLIFIDHILDSIKKIESYTGTLSLNDFQSNELVQDAVIRNFEVIGEASKKVPKDFKDINQHIPWLEMTNMRNILIHDYIKVDVGAIWETIKKDLPKLKSDLEALKDCPAKNQD